MATAEMEKPKTKKRSAKSLRNEIRERLKTIDDADLLHALLVLLQNTVQREPLRFSKKLRLAIDEGKRAVAEGRVQNNDDVMQRATQWLDEH